jgi:signal peptidase I
MREVAGGEPTRGGKFRTSSIGDTLKTILWAVLIALLIRTFAFESFNIPSSSMVPTLLVGDYLFVSKFSYGYSRYSLPYGLGWFTGRILERPVERGDVVVFRLPRDPRTDYIKRIVGLPGDRIQVLNGVLHVNGQAVRRERIEDWVEAEDGRITRATQYMETLPSGHRYHVIQYTDSGALDNTTEYVVPAGHYFAMGDNRNNSLDSRVLNAVGFIPAENLIGRAEIIFFSTDGSAALWEFWRWPSAVRYSRLFTRIE